jgi:hypothetical protein
MLRWQQLYFEPGLAFSFARIRDGIAWRHLFHNWHIEAIEHQLMMIHQRANRRLLITQPPRSLKVHLCLGCLCGLAART